MNPGVLIESIRCAIAEDASDEARAAGVHACRALLGVLEPTPAESIAPSAPTPQAPNLPIAAIVSAIRGMPMEQLADLLIAKLRTLVPAEAASTAATRVLNIPRVKVPAP